MPNAEPRVRWAPRVRRDKLKRLYGADAGGLVDDDLIDDVGFALYSRCRSILTVSAAMHGRVACPECETIMVRERLDAEFVLHCPTCGWETTWGRYHKTFQHQELYGGGAVDAFARFVERWEGAASRREKMLLIDQLIHVWHWEGRQDHILGRPAGVNLIEGNRRQVIQFLDQLTYGAASTPDVRETGDRWRATLAQNNPKSFDCHPDEGGDWTAASCSPNAS